MKRRIGRFGWHHMDIGLTDTTPQRVEVEIEQTFTGPFVGFVFKV